MSSSTETTGQGRKRNKLKKWILGGNSSGANVTRPGPSSQTGQSKEPISNANAGSLPTPVAHSQSQRADHPDVSENLVQRDVDGKVLLERSLQQLSNDERRILRQHTCQASEEVSTVLQRALETAKDKQNLCERKKWTFAFCDRTLILQDEAKKIVNWLDRFKAIGDAAASADPIHIGLPWAGVRMPIEVCFHRPTVILIFNMSMTSDTQ